MGICIPEKVDNCPPLIFKKIHTKNLMCSDIIGRRDRTEKYTEPSQPEIPLSIKYFMYKEIHNRASLKLI